nr:PREDICTED: uncharacterized protein LOC109039425 [Bemisia tabaci]
MSKDETVYAASLVDTSVDSNNSLFVRSNVSDGTSLVGQSILNFSVGCDPDFDPVTFDEPVQQVLYSAEEEEEEGRHLDESPDNLLAAEAAYLADDVAMPGLDGAMTPPPVSPEAEKTETQKVEAMLAYWAVKKKITLVALNELLKGLKDSHPCFSDMHVDARTILKTPREKMPITDVPPGHLIYLGVKYHVDIMLSLLEDIVNLLRLLFYADGLQVFNSTSYQMWVLSMSAPNIPRLKHKVFPVSIYYGKGKPKDVSEFLQPFIDEVIQLFSTDDQKEECKIYMKGQRVHIETFGFGCDTPARSYLLQTVGHTGFYSCFRCTTRGLTSNKRRCFPKVDAPLRTDEKFRRRKYSKFQPKHLQLSPLLQLPGLNFTRSFINDPMHLLFQGCTKSMLKLWFKSGIPNIIDIFYRKQINEKLKYAVTFLPREFQRRPRGLESLADWKATEFRAFALYLGPVILKGSLDEADYYLHFLSFSIALIILFNPLLIKIDELINYADELLRSFVVNMSVLYGEWTVSHNIHHLIHLVEDVWFFKDSVPDFTLIDIANFFMES